MIRIKNKQEIETIAEGGRRLSTVITKVKNAAHKGVKLQDLDELAKELIEKQGGRPSFLHYSNSPDIEEFPSSICACINSEVVHAFGNRAYELKDGDILSLDIGMEYMGFYSDMAITFGIGKISEDAKRLIQVTKNVLVLGIKQLKPSKPLSLYSRTVQEYVEKNGFSVVRNLVGHGVGYEVHEEPHIPNYIDNRFDEIILKPGMVLAIEPMVNMGRPEVEIQDDGWTVTTADGSLSAHFEHTVAITERGCRVLTK